MTMDENLKRMENESDNEYFMRICSLKDALGFTWTQMAQIFNEEFGLCKTESAYRKRWNASKDVSVVVDRGAGEDKYPSDIRAQIDELYKAKRQFYDQRREYNKALMNDARADHLAEKLIEAANLAPLNNYSNIFTFDEQNSNQEALLCCSDWHYGSVSNNIWNVYNVDICKQRISKLFNKVVDALHRHNVKTLHVALLGDLVSGAIHTSVRVASEENVCEQLMHVSEIIANFINELSAHVENINVYSTYGNHARVIQNKEDSIHSDNFERIIPWWLSQRLQNNNRVRIIDSEYYEFICFDICGYNVACTHGDVDKFKDIGVTINSLFSKKYGKTINYTFSGDKHHLESFEQFGIESTLVGSLCGTDEYANNKRLYSNPMQTLCIFTPEDGKLCSYNIKL